LTTGLLGLCNRILLFSFKAFLFSPNIANHQRSGEAFRSQATAASAIIHPVP